MDASLEAGGLGDDARLLKDVCASAALRLNGRLEAALHILVSSLASLPDPPPPPSPVLARAVISAVELCCVVEDCEMLGRVGEAARRGG